MVDIYSELLKIIDKKDILINELMQKHTSFKIGGPADFFVTIRDVDTLKKVKKLSDNENIPFFVIGNGSNLLVLDKGIRGIVAKLNFNKLEFKNEKVEVSCDISVSKLSRMCCKNGLSRSRIFSWNSRYYGWSSKNECWSSWLRNKRYFSKNNLLG